MVELVKKKRRGIGWFVIWSFVGLVIAVLIAAVVVWFSIDGLIRSKVESTATTAVGQKVTLSSVNLSPFAGKLAMGDMVIANPHGFSDPAFVKMGACKIHVETMSLLSSTVQVPTIDINGLQVYIQQQGLSNNLAAISKAIHKNTAAATPVSTPSHPATSAPGNAAPQASAKSRGKAMHVGVVTLTNTVAQISLSGVPGMKPRTITLKLPVLTMHDPTNANGRALRMADLMGQIIQAVAVQVSQDPQVPSVVRIGAKAALGLSGNNLSGAASALTHLGTHLGVKHIGAAKNIVQGVGNLLNGGKHKRPH